MAVLYSSVTTNVVPAEVVEAGRGGDRKKEHPYRVTSYIELEKGLSCATIKERSELKRLFCNKTASPW